ncbi:MAG: ABC transporter ATP-binding protein [Methylacidiphilales bacterium]|nr:ABC transporter ATP-binding protein [Candidatus Methylacidiphilales bacterium]
MSQEPKSHSSTPSLRRVLEILALYPWLVFVGIISLLLLIATNALTPQLFRWGIDRGISENNLDVVFKCSLLLVLAAVGRGIFSFGQNFCAESVSQNVAYRLRNQVFSKTQNLSLSYYKNTSSGQLLTRITSDVEQIRTFIGTTLLQVTSGLITLITSSVIVFTMNWKLALITLTAIPIAGFLLSQFFKKNSKLFGMVQAKLANLNSILEENLIGVRVVKAFVREKSEISRYTTLNGELLAVNIQTVKVLRNLFPFLFLLSNLISLAVIGFGGAEVISNRFSLGELIAFNSYLVFILQPVLQIGFAAGVIAQAAASAKRVYEIIDAKIDIYNHPNAIVLNASDIKGEIKFEHVDFRYSGSTTEILKNISFEVKSGEFIAIVGMTGSGKSTIANLIPRFYDVTSGVVQIDGYDVRDLKLESLRSQVATVFQDATLFSGTIHENIAYGLPDASSEQIIEAAKIAQIHDFISTLPDGYNTIVGERGIGLSGGQKQRVAIARTVLTDFQILILDDATSAVDAKTGSLILESLEKLRQARQCTIIAIAQRISSIRNADKILLIDKGEIVAQGKHGELLETSSLYAAILDSQIKQSQPIISQIA